MGMKSRLFASAAFPLLSLSLVMPPVHSFAAVASVDQVRAAPQAVAGSFEVAQDAPSDEELLKKRHKQHDGGGKEQAPAAQEQPPQQAAPAEQPQQQQEAPAEKPHKQRQPAAEAQPEQQEAPAEKPRRQQEPAAEQQSQQLQEEVPAEKPRKKRQPAAEQAEPAAPQEQVAPAQQQQPAENQEKPRRKRDKQQSLEEAAPQPQTEQAAPQQEQAQPQGAESQPKGKGGSKQQATEGSEQPVKPRKNPAAAEAQQQQTQKPAAEQTPVPQDPPAPEKPPVPAQEPATEAQPGGAQPAQQQGEQVPVPQQGEQAPAQQQGEQIPAQPKGAPTDQPATGQAEQVIPAPETITPKELERRKAIAADPSKSTETVVLPVENGAAVLDSDKDADRSGGIQSRRDRDRQRGQEQNFRVPKSDADAQIVTEGAKAAPIRIEAVTSEEGRRLDRRPQFERPEGARFGERGDDNRVIIQINNQTIVRGDDDRRFLRDGERPIYEQLPRDRYRETIDRDGYQIVTIRNRYGDIIQRSRVDNRGRESVLYYSPDLYEDPDRGYFEDPGRDLPPMRLRIPLDDYIMDTSSDDDRNYYDFLREPPVEPVERVYSLDEVKYSARIRDKVRRIDLDTITFATGSAEIPMSQARSLRKVADAINEVLRKDPAETFLIEGHTDSVGSDQSNLVLSDQRAESVANVMTDVYGIPPENLATQGYGERYLKVNTQGPNQENRRVTIRRVTALVRPVASRN
ncbi:MULTISPECIES: OmpA family protein [Rhizobium]|uniref:OmpA/MotB domain protein n=1 Tax=Rhizobium favelukesii TaxID=348824 RepID=W6R9D5_9HYPH|nr:MULTISPECIES: OmpA family protein [Rhizobium]MCS0458164.1 OmpA family protein [Rhizobium favelukesii]UFS80675.1 OmpA family protein [Rhizobium sp. T136]CDM57882.1 putative OmpA/MotB domain protein [Rhizobium favelukesii]